MCGFMFRSSILFCSSTYLFLCQHHTFYCYTSIVQLEIGGGDVFCSSLIVLDCFNYPEIFVFSYEAKNCPLVCCPDDYSIEEIGILESSTIIELM